MAALAGAVSRGRESAYGDAPRIHRCGAFDALFSPIHRALLPAFSPPRKGLW
jgi:hypothetical protein